MTFDLIEFRPGKLNGQPCVVGTRLTVRRVLLLLATYPNRAELFREFPELNEPIVQQVFKFAQAQMSDQTVEWSEVA